MSTEYAVLDQDGNQMGLPASSWAEKSSADVFQQSLEQARVRAINEGRAAEVVFTREDTTRPERMTRSFREELEDRITRGKRAAAASYHVVKREVGPWQTT